MAIIRQNWYNENELRNYPLDDSATRTGSNVVLPQDVLVDAHFWLPKSAGNRVWLSSISLTDNLITMTFQSYTEQTAGSSSSGSTGFVPLATASVTAPFTKYQPIPITAVYPGVGGWIVLGAGAEESRGYYTFVDPEAGVLLPKAVKVYQDTLVQSIKRTDLTKELTGLVRLRAAGDIRLRKAIRSLNDEAVETLMIGLDTETRPVKQVMDPYLANGSEAPESNNCRKTPIESINGVIPRCPDGNINIIFPPEIIPVQYCDDPGLVLDHALGLSDVCDSERVLIDREGRICQFPVEAPPYDESPPEPSIPEDSDTDPGEELPVGGEVCIDFSDCVTGFKNPARPVWSCTEHVKPVDYTQYRLDINNVLRTDVNMLIYDSSRSDPRDGRVVRAGIEFTGDPWAAARDGTEDNKWDNIGLIYSYEAVNKYHFAAVIWLGTNADYADSAEEPTTTRNAMLVSGYKNVAEDTLTPYGYNIDTGEYTKPRGLTKGHFITDYKFIKISAEVTYILQASSRRLIDPARTQVEIKLMEYNSDEAVQEFEPVLDDDDNEAIVVATYVDSGSNPVADEAEIGMLVVEGSDVGFTDFGIDCSTPPYFYQPEEEEEPIPPVDPRTTITVTFPEKDAYADIGYTVTSTTNMFFQPVDVLFDTGPWTYVPDGPTGTGGDFVHTYDLIDGGTRLKILDQDFIYGRLDPMRVTFKAVLE